MQAIVANRLNPVTGIFSNFGYFFFIFVKSCSNIFIGTFRTNARIRPTIIGRINAIPLCTLLITVGKCISKANNTTPNVINKRLLFVSFSIKSTISPFLFYNFSEPFLFLILLDFKEIQEYPDILTSDAPDILLYNAMLLLRLLRQLLPDEVLLSGHHQWQILLVYSCVLTRLQ